MLYVQVCTKATNFCWYASHLLQPLDWQQQGNRLLHVFQNLNIVSLTQQYAHLDKLSIVWFGLELDLKLWVAHRWLDSNLISVPDFSFVQPRLTQDMDQMSGKSCRLVPELSQGKVFCYQDVFRGKLSGTRTFSSSSFPPSGFSASCLSSPPCPPSLFPTTESLAAHSHLVQISS